MRSANSSAGIVPLNALHEYSIVALPGQLVQQKIMDERIFFSDRLDLVQPVEKDAFVSIANYYAKEVMEETLIRWFQNIARLQNGFNVTLNNFSSISPGSIYLRILETDPFIQLANSIKIIDAFVQANDCPPIQLIHRPVIEFLSGLPENTYESAVYECARRSFTASFRIEKLALLKREFHSDPLELMYSFTLSNNN
jgi:hypothetical protein